MNCLPTYKDFHKIKVFLPYSQFRLEGALLFAEQGNACCTVMIALGLTKRKMLFTDK